MLRAKQFILFHRKWHPLEMGEAEARSGQAQNLRGLRDLWQVCLPLPCQELPHKMPGRSFASLTLLSSRRAMATGQGSWPSSTGAMLAAREHGDPWPERSGWGCPAWVCRRRPSTLTPRVSMAPGDGRPRDGRGCPAGEGAPGLCVLTLRVSMAPGTSSGWGGGSSNETAPQDRPSDPGAGCSGQLGTMSPGPDRRVVRNERVVPGMTNVHNSWPAHFVVLARPCRSIAQDKVEDSTNPSLAIRRTGIRLGEGTPKRGGVWAADRGMGAAGVRLGKPLIA